MRSTVLMRPKKIVSHSTGTLAASAFYDATRSCTCSLVTSINIARVKWRNSHLTYKYGSDLANGTLTVFFFPREWSMRCEKLMHVLIAISQAGITAPTLTVNARFYEVTWRTERARLNKQRFG